MRHYFSYCPCSASKQWHMPFCAFFTSFTLVMTILILSTDLKVGMRYVHFNSSYLWEFEKNSQEIPTLSDLIREQYFQLPKSNENSSFTDPALVKKPSVQIYNFFREKKYGIFMELGSDGKGDTEWLEKVLHWKGLLTQPRPDKFESLTSRDRRSSYFAQVCVSPTVYPKHAYFKYNESYNGSLMAVPCFPLYSLMKAYNTSHLDLLSFSEITAPIQVLKTLPIGRIRIKAIAFKNYSPEEEEEDLCCDEELTSLLDKWGYKGMYSCNESFISKCYFVCARTYCPMLTRT